MKLFASWLPVIFVGLQVEGEPELERARRLLDEGALVEALEPLERSYSLRPNSPDVLWMLAVVNLRLGREAQGVSYAESLVALAPREARSRLLLGSYREALAEDDEAIAEYRAVLEVEPSHPQALNRLAHLYMRRGEDDVAVALLERILEKYPNDARALAPLGVLYFRQARAREAVELLTRAVRESPDSYEAQYHLGAVYSTLGHYELAKSHLGEALKLRENDPACLFEMGLLHARQEQLGEAKAYLERAREARPEHAETYFQLGSIYAYESEVDQAERAYRKTIELDSGHALASQALGRLYLQSGRAGEAESMLRRAVELRPEDGEVHHQLARACDQLDRPDEARGHFEASLELLPFAPEPRLSFGNFLLRHGELEHGRRMIETFRELKEIDDRTSELKAAIDFDPSDPRLKEALIEHLLDNGRSEEALEQSRRFVALATMEPLHHLMLARCFREDGEKARALAVLEDARRSFRAHPAVEAAYAENLALSERADEARSILLEADEDEPDIQRAWAIVHDALGDTKSAEASFLRSVELDARNPERYIDYADWLAAAGRREAAVEQLESATATIPDSSELHRHLARLYRAMGRESEARRESALARELLRSTRVHP
ncbi:MAG TPA: tetratricopeptide repeat protein [Vicinamibacteria bacterium]|nr:tetratricopeptide repeat protein [Vicinamibacteria bacterium]